MDVKEILLNLNDREKKERKQVLKDYLFYLGQCEDIESAKLNRDLLGQNWITFDDLDYVPSQVIDNKVKPLINKQARFMFGKEPDILFKPLDRNSKETCEELRQFIDAILNASKFWSNTIKAFRLATVTKRVMLRLEANPGQPVRLYWHDINNCNYEVEPNDITKLNKVILVRQDGSTIKKQISEQIWYRYIYYMNNAENKEASCYLRIETFKGDNLETPIKIKDLDTGLSKIPCWIICNEQSIVNPYGQSDIKDLKPLQDQYNRKLSDFSDALRFNMFGQDVFIDATPDSVNASKVAPNSVIVLVSLDEKKADYKKVENTFSNAEPAKMYLNLLENSMYEKIGIPRAESLQQVPSAKSIKYMYTELVARCEEKWHDWEPTIRQMIRLIVEACAKFDCYEDWNHNWDKLLYNIVLRHNYPIPEDEEDRKKLAMEEVRTNVRSHRSYIKDFTYDEDVENVLKEICEDITSITAAEHEEFLKDM